MFVKLLKYDLKWILKVPLAFLAIAVLFFSVGWGLSLAASAPFWGFLRNFVQYTALGLLLGAMFACILRSWRRFQNQIWKDEAYLARTFPVSLNSLAGACIVSGILSIFVCLCVSWLILVVFADSVTYVRQLAEVGSGVAGVLDMNGWALTGSFVFELGMQLGFLFLCGIAGLAIGHLLPSGRMLIAVLAGIALYMGISGLAVLVAWLVSLANPAFHEMMFGDGMLPPAEWVSLFKAFLCSIVVWYALWNLGLSFLSCKLIAKSDVE